MLDSLNLHPLIIEEGSSDLPPELQGIRELGVPIGSCEFVRQFLLHKTQNIIELMLKVEAMVRNEEEEGNLEGCDRGQASASWAQVARETMQPGKQVALLLFRYLYTSRFTFLSRTCLPDQLHEACNLLESASKSIFERIFCLPSLSPSAWSQASLPIRMGGLGLIPPVQTSCNGFSASIIRFFHHNISKILPHFDFDVFWSSSSYLVPSVSSAFKYADAFLASIPASSEVAIKTMGDVVQHHLAAWSNKNRSDELLQSLDVKGKVRTSSESGKGAAAFLIAIPSTSDLLIPSYLFPIVICNYLGVAFPYVLPQYCVCENAIDRHGEHLSLCPHRAAQRSHDNVVACIKDLAHQSGHGCSGASSLLHFNPDSNVVADLRINSSIPSKPDTVIDVHIRNSCAPSSFDAHNNPLPIAMYAEHSKEAKHAAYLRAAHCSFVPFVMDRFGTLAPKAISLYASLVKQVPLDCFEADNWAARTPLQYWPQRLSVTLVASEAKEEFNLWYRASMRELGCVNTAWY